MEELLDAMSRHREDRDFREKYTTQARIEMPDILDWCQEDSQKNIMAYLERLCHFRYLDLCKSKKNDDLYAQQFFMRSQEHRRLGLILLMQFFRAGLSRNDVVGVPLEDVIKGMLCTHATARRIIKDAIEGEFIGKTENHKKRNVKILYIKEVGVHTFLNKGISLFYNPLLEELNELDGRIREDLDKTGRRESYEKRKKIERDWLENRGKKYKNGRRPS